MDDEWEVEAVVQYRTYYRNGRVPARTATRGRRWSPSLMTLKEQAARVKDIALAAGVRTSVGAALPPTRTGPIAALADRRRSPLPPPAPTAAGVLPAGSGRER
jgi:hypothetical protein